MKLEVGKSYINGWDNEVQIIASNENPTSGSGRFIGLASNGTGHWSVVDYEGDGKQSQVYTESQLLRFGNTSAYIGKQAITGPWEDYVVLSGGELKRVYGQLESLKLRHGTVYKRV